MSVSSKQITEFNQSYPVGTEVELLSISNKPPVKTRITKEARRFFGANVVNVEGEPYVELSRYNQANQRKSVTKGLCTYVLHEMWQRYVFVR